MRFLRNPWFLLGLGLWQLVVLFTPVSLYGFWTDVVVFLAWLSWSGYLALSFQFRRRWLRHPCRLSASMAWSYRGFRSSFPHR